jgi:hypothetical protein
MGFADDCLAVHLRPPTVPTVVEQVFDYPPDRLFFNFAGTGMHSGSGISKGGKAPARVPRFSDLALNALQQSTLESNMTKGAIAAIAMVLETDDKIKDLNRQRARIVRNEGETPLLNQVAGEERARLDAQRGSAMRSLSTLLGGSGQGLPSIDLHAAVVERARQQQPEVEGALHSGMANMQMEDPGDTVITGKFHVLSADEGEV